MTRNHIRAAAGLAFFALTVTAAPAALADDDPRTMGTSQAPVKLDKNDPDLKKVDSAQLQPPKVLDIKSVVGDEGGTERREDTTENVKFALQAEVLFDKDSAKLSAEASSRIEEIAAEVKKQNAQEVRVFGFTDNLGSAAHGKVLSKKRAQAVNNELSKDLPSDVSFSIRGYGEDYPIASNDDEEGRKKNRRVEVSFPRS